MFRQIGLFLLLLTIFFGLNPAWAKSLSWDKITVDIYINHDSTVSVLERLTYVFNGSWNGGYRDIRIKGFDSLAVISLSEGKTNYEQGSLDKHHFKVGNYDGAKRIKWRSRWANEPEYKNSKTTFALKYKVYGLLSYHKNYDEIYWKAIFEDREGVVKSAQVKLHFPEAIDFNKLKVNLFTGTSGATWRKLDRKTILFIGRNLYPNELFEIKVQFPPGLIVRKTSTKRFIRTYLSPYLPFGFLGIAFFFMLGLYLRLGRDYEVKGGPKRVYTLPSDLGPALAGTLIDEDAGMKEIVATIIDLSRRGFFEITELVEQAWVFSKQDFKFELKKMPEGLNEYEKKVLRGLFAMPKVGETIKLSQLKNKFFKKLPEI
jgi:predicted membrane protein DUF2207